MARIVTLTAILAAGCALDTGGLPRGAPPSDAGPAPVFDAGPIGMPCDPSSQRCEAGVAIRCGPSDQTLTENCAAMGLVCTEAGGAPHCVPAPTTCEPNARRCVGDDLATCRPDGSGEDITTCDFGCEANLCRGRPACDAADIGVGFHRLDTCGAGDDETPFDSTTDSCVSSPDARGEDLLLRWQVTREATYRIHLRDDWTSGSFVDPVLSIRTDCEEPSSQFACNDDGLGYPDSLIVRRFPVGTYYIVVDSYASGGADPCGDFAMLIEED